MVWVKRIAIVALGVLLTLMVIGFIVGDRKPPGAVLLLTDGEREVRISGEISASENVRLEAGSMVRLNGRHWVSLVNRELAVNGRSLGVGFGVAEVRIAADGSLHGTVSWVVP